MKQGQRHSEAFITQPPPTHTRVFNFTGIDPLRKGCQVLKSGHLPSWLWRSYSSFLVGFLSCGGPSGLAASVPSPAVPFCPAGSPSSITSGSGTFCPGTSFFIKGTSANISSSVTSLCSSDKSYSRKDGGREGRGRKIRRTKK